MPEDKFSHDTADVYFSGIYLETKTTLRFGSQTTVELLPTFLHLIRRDKERTLHLDWTLLKVCNGFTTIFLSTAADSTEQSM